MFFLVSQLGQRFPFGKNQSSNSYSHLVGCVTSPQGCVVRFPGAARSLPQGRSLASQGALARFPGARSLPRGPLGCFTSLLGCVRAPLGTPLAMIAGMRHNTFGMRHITIGNDPWDGENVESLCGVSNLTCCVMAVLPRPDGAQLYSLTAIPRRMRRISSDLRS